MIRPIPTAISGSDAVYIAKADGVFTLLGTNTTLSTTEQFEAGNVVPLGIAAAAQGQNVDPAKLIEGSELTLKMLGSAMEKFGVTEVNPQGERFNPQFHEAMSIQPRADVEPNTVVTVVQKGYLLNDRLIRPAMVIVSKAVPGAEPGSPAGPGVDVRA